MKERYTIKDVIVDTKDRRLSYFDDIYVGDTPSEVLKHANNDDSDYLGKFACTDDHYDYSYFILDNNNEGFQCAIKRKTHMVEYDPHPIVASFLSDYAWHSQQIQSEDLRHLAQTGIWLFVKTEKGIVPPICAYVSELSDAGLRISYNFIYWNDFFSSDNFAFLDGSPVSRKV